MLKLYIKICLQTCEFDMNLRLSIKRIISFTSSSNFFLEISIKIRSTFCWSLCINNNAVRNPFKWIFTHRNYLRLYIFNLFLRQSSLPEFRLLAQNHSSPTISNIHRFLSLNRPKHPIVFFFPPPSW